MKIGLTHTGSSEKHLNYVNWIKGNEDIQIVELSMKNNNLYELNNCDGLVLSGGMDIHPGFYGSKNLDYHFRPDQFNLQRDEFEINAFKKSQEKNIPVLGICRGMQLVNCALGGNLKQDLGASLNKIHKAEKTGNVQMDKAHGINIEAGTLLNEITEKQERAVANSAHHQSVKKPGRGLKVNCRADDGTVEGLEWADKKNKSFLLCIQWHPERMFRFQLQHSALSKTIRDRFIEETQKSKQKGQ